MNEEQIKKIIEKNLPALQNQRGKNLKYKIIKNRILDVETPFNFMEYTGPTEITFNVSPRRFPNLLVKVFVEIPQMTNLPNFLKDDLIHVFLEFEDELNTQMLYEFGDKSTTQELIELKHKQTQKKKEGKRLHLYDKLDLLEAEENVKKSISLDATSNISMNNNKEDEKEFIKQKKGYGILDNTPENENKLRDSGWGHEKIEISFEDWVAVMQGKALGIHDGESTHFITVDKTAPVDASFWEKMFLNKSKEFDNLYNEVSKFLKNSKSS